MAPTPAPAPAPSPTPSPGPSPTPGYAFANSEAQALYSRDATIAPTDARKQVIDNLVGALKSAGVWTKLDVLYVTAAASQSASLLNWMGATFGAAPVASPVFVADRGWFANGLSSYLDLGFAPSGLALFTQNSASYGAWMRTPAGAARANSILGTQTGNLCTLNARTTSGVIGARINGATADTGVASADFFGLTSVNRPSSTQIQSARNGARGALISANSTARSSIGFAFGRCNSVFAEGQMQAFFAGASLTDAEEAALYNALASYMTAVGVAPLVAATRTLALASGTKLPDGSSAPTAGKGMANTGLARRSDGKWYVGNGLTNGQNLLFTRLSADFLTIEQEYTVASLGLASPPGAGSVQGLCLDAADANVMWVVHKIGNGGSTTYLYSVNLTTGALIAGPFALPTLSCNGVADDGVAGTLLITQDISQSIGGLIRVSKADGTNTGAIAHQTPGDTDQMFYVTAAVGSEYQAGDLLVTSGPNVSGGNGRVDVMRRDEYGGYCARRVETLTGADAIEGLVLAGSTYFVCNDGSTHPGTPVENRVLTYEASSATPTPAPSPTPSPTPSAAPADWRMPAATSTSANLSGSQSALAAGQQGVGSKSRPTFTVPANATEFVEWTVQQAGSLIVSWLGQETDGSVTIARNGAALPNTAQKPSTASVLNTRRQGKLLTVAAGDVVRMTVAAGASAQTIAPLLHLRPGSGPWNATLILGASREDQGLPCAALEASMIASVSTSDPLVFNFAVSSETLANVLARADEAAPIFAGIAYIVHLGNVAGNDVTTNRPYTSAQGATITSQLQSLKTKLAGFPAISMGSLSYRAYPGVTPAAQAGGSLEYNSNCILPFVRDAFPTFWDAAVERPRYDEYLAILAGRGSLSDQVHGAYAEMRAAYVNSLYVWLTTGSWTGAVKQIEQRVAAFESAVTLPTDNEAAYAISALVPGSIRDAFQARYLPPHRTVLYNAASVAVGAFEASRTANDKTTAQQAVQAARDAGYSPSANLDALDTRIAAVTVATVLATIKIAHGRSTAVNDPSGDVWNYVNESTSTGVLIANLVDTAGNPTGYSYEVTSPWSGASTNAAKTSQIAGVPDNALLTAINRNGATASFRLNGFDPARKIDATFVPSRDGSSSRVAAYRFNGVTALGEAEATNNNSASVKAANLSPLSDGSLPIEVRRGSGNASFVYHTASIFVVKAS